MINQTNKNNIPQRNIETKSKKFKVWLGDDGIVRIKASKTKVDERILEMLGKDYREIARKLSVKPKLLIDISMVQFGSNITFRKNAVKFIKDMFEDPGFERMAIWGGGAVIKVTISFVVTAAGMTNIQYFKTEEEALKWLKEE